jgi:hypothetical protein
LILFQDDDGIAHPDGRRRRAINMGMPRGCKYILLKKMLPALMAGGIACSSMTGGGVYPYKSSHAGTSRESEVSDQKIAADTTYQVFFTLKKPEKCIKISIKSEIREPTLKKTVTSEVNTYYIVERIIDISRYKIDKKTANYGIGRNFDSRWNSSSTIVMCDDEADPLMRLDPGIYRIRFSSFMPQEYNFTIDIYSKNEPAIFGL